MTDTFTTSDGRALSFRREGAGPLLVCHPGGPGFSSRYFGDLAGLGEDFELVLLDPRGTDGSDRPSDPGAYRIDDYVGDVEALRAHLGVERLKLLGHSHGGVVAAAYAIAHPNRVERLVLASTLARFAAEQEHAMVEGMERHADEPWYEDARAALEAEQNGDFETDEELGALAIRELKFYFADFDDEAAAYLDTLSGERVNGDALRLFNAEIFTTFDLRPELPRITAPTLVITGEQDFITGPVCARDFSDAIPNAETSILPNAGHMIFVESRAAVREEVRRFLTA